MAFRSRTGMFFSEFIASALLMFLIYALKDVSVSLFLAVAYQAIIRLQEAQEPGKDTRGPLRSLLFPC